jgi:PncC family amidohydrolase
MDSLDGLIYSKVLEVIRLLRDSNHRLVLAESCTGGLISSWFVSIPGVSDVFCGSMVVYRNETKSKWLGLDPLELADPRVGPVGGVSSEKITTGLMLRTPEASFGLGITGHFGPGAPDDLNHRIFLVWTRRHPDQSRLVSVHRHLQVENPESPNRFGITNASQHEGLMIAMNFRRHVQSVATLAALQFAADMLHGLE